MHHLQLQRVVRPLFRHLFEMQRNEHRSFHRTSYPTYIHANTIMNPMDTLDSTSEALEALMTIRASACNASSNNTTSPTSSDSANRGSSSIGPKETSSALKKPFDASKEPIPIAPANSNNPYAANVQNGMQTNAQAYNFLATTHQRSQHGQFVNPALQRRASAYTHSSLQVASYPTAVIMPQNQQNNTATSLVLTKEPVRTDEVERALKSKSQRGKKRENLNNDERKELTRSRNRMHAKTTRCESVLFSFALCTFFRSETHYCLRLSVGVTYPYFVCLLRIRKKARHDELADCEKNYQELVEEKAHCDFHSDLRRSTVLKFIALCNELINVQMPSGDDSESSTWKSAFGQASSSGPCNRMQIDVQDIFTPTPMFSITSAFGTNRPNMDYQGMLEYERDFAHELREMFSDSPGLRLDYIIPGSKDSIALSNTDTAFCNYQIAATMKDDCLCILSCGLMQVCFVEHSHKIASVGIHVTLVKDSVAHEGEAEDEGSSTPPLGNCDPFPSVVSLDTDTKNKGKDA